MWSVCAVLLGCGVGPALADEGSLAATLDREVAAVGEQVAYTVTWRGGNASPGVKLPALPNFVVYQAGTSRNISFINGSFSASVTYTYLLLPKGPGKFGIGPAEVEVNGKVYRSNSLELEVRTTPAPRSGPSAPVPAPPSRVRRASAGRDVFVRATVDRPRPYANQQVTWTFKFYNATARLARTPEYTGPPVTGFWSEELPPQRNYY